VNGRSSLRVCVSRRSDFWIKANASSTAIRAAACDVHIPEKVRCVSMVRSLKQIEEFRAQELAAKEELAKEKSSLKRFRAKLRRDRAEHYERQKAKLAALATFDDNAETIPTTVENIMRGEAFRRGVADVRAG
jgi:hypothetical protein